MIAHRALFTPALCAGTGLQYSLWSHDELLGYTNLSMPSEDPDQQSGVFEPEPPFERIEPILDALQRAMQEFESDAPLPSPEEMAAMSRDDQIRVIRAALGEHSVVRRVVESQRAVDAFALHLRDEHDREVPTQFIAIHRIPDDLGGDAGPLRAATDALGAAPARYVLVARMEERAAP
ncbi:MAG: hypothetical protein KGL93_01480 [Gemmatimonadota bacterium]|nr:hypothetical protein [Gemmatimonadota bacterium]